MKQNLTKYFVYVRKSTRGQEKQMLSIQGQLDAVAVTVKQFNLTVVDTIRERESAHTPGRPHFNEMLRRIEQGEANGIIAWHPDRLARNSKDGGELIYLLDTGKLTDLKFTNFWFENTPQGKSNLGHEFVQTKQYSDKLACDTGRGLRDKAKMGWYPSIAPRGYLNNRANKTIVLDPVVAPVIRQAFELYATGEKSIDDMQDFFASRGLVSKKRCNRSKGGERLNHELVREMLSNPFYYGCFKYAGEFYEGKHTPIVSKALFDRAQAARENRGHHYPKRELPKPFVGLLRCGECGMAITSEVQKGHTYYRCTKKGRTRKCSQRYMREEALGHELSGVLSNFVLRSDWADSMLTMVEKEQNELSQANRQLVQTKQAELITIQARQDRLTKIYLDEDIDRETYLAQKVELVSQKKTVQEIIKCTEDHSNAWLEPFKTWINTAKTLGETVAKGSLTEKRGAITKVFGSNLFLEGKKARGYALKPWFFLNSNEFSLEMVTPSGIEPESQV